MAGALSDRLWLWLAAGFYAAGFLLGTASLVKRGRPSGAFVYVLMAIGCALQFVGLGQRGKIDGGCPLGNTFEILQFTAWSAIALYLVVGAIFRSSLLGYLTAALTAVLTIASLAVPAWDSPHHNLIFGSNPWIEFHAALAVFSYGVFALLALTSLLFLLRHYSLKSMRLDGWFFFLPSIFDLDHIGVRLLGVGVVLLAASLAVGGIYWVRDPASVTAAHLAGTLAVWVAYAVALGLRLRGRLLARRFAWTCVILFAAALFSLGLVNTGSRSAAAGRASPLQAAMQEK